MCSIRETRLLLARCLASGLVALTQAFDAVVKFLAIIDIRYRIGSSTSATDYST